MKNLEGIQIGDRVWSPNNGWETVESIARGNKDEYPIELSNGNNYTIDGRYHSNDKYPSIFFDIPNFYKEKTYPKRPRWRAEQCGAFYFIQVNGVVGKATEDGDNSCTMLHSAGNYFKNKEDAENSNIFKAYLR